MCGCNKFTPKWHPLARLLSCNCLASVKQHSTSMHCLEMDLKARTRNSLACLPSLCPALASLNDAENGGKTKYIHTVYKLTCALLKQMSYLKRNTHHPSHEWFNAPYKKNDFPYVCVHSASNLLLLRKALFLHNFSCKTCIKLCVEEKWHVKVSK